ncbi:Cysteine-rich membrane protein 2 [Spironucleus salmonicida]|uniref:Cysteine-rich membrane protein 2 n=1 Tax=Spironucleus salmonicida TaxID=348837 RepID=V6LQ77_9EUKA|nr:Cysteine-rich membrane protein 2 [Spironucleus salmonicida]|eukprot:EST42914.1 Cysteine-rich membrane protein 2 [Spironucleus salmonicida]
MSIINTLSYTYQFTNPEYEEIIIRLLQFNFLFAGGTILLLIVASIYSCCCCCFACCCRKSVVQSKNKPNNANQAQYVMVSPLQEVPATANNGEGLLSSH